MSALTLKQISDALSIYTPSDGSFVPRINQTLSRLHNMGTYRDLTVQYSLPVVGGCIYLPTDAEAVLHTAIDGKPAAVRSLWHDFKIAGTASNDLTWGLVDAGYSPVLLDLQTATDTLYLVPSAGSPTKFPFVGTEDSGVSLSASDGTTRFRAETYDSGFDGTTIVFPEPVLYIESIRFDHLGDSFDLRIIAGDIATTVATVGPGSGVTRYRRFRVPGTEDGRVVHVLCKRAFIPLVEDTDITYLGNINAIKNGLLATVAEDSNDVERAQLFWNTAFQLLEEEASSTRGAAQLRLNLDPHGVGGGGGLRGMM
jgi:hypothetical protein